MPSLIAWLVLFSPSAIRNAAEMHIEYPGMKVERLYQFLMSTFPDKEALKAEKNGMLWSPILKYAVVKLDRLDCDRGVDR